MALHAGEISYDKHGTTAAAVNLAFRLSDADALKAALASSPGVLAVIASSWFFQEVINHSPACDAGAYRRVRVTVKETTTIGWIHFQITATHPAARRLTVCPAAGAITTWTFFLVSQRIPNARRLISHRYSTWQQMCPLTLTSLPRGLDASAPRRPAVSTDPSHARPCREECILSGISETLT